MSFPLTIDNQSSFFAQSPILASIKNAQIGISVSEKQSIAHQLLVLIRDYYVHLPLKTSSLAIDPVQEASLLLDDVPFFVSDSEFFRRTVEMVTRLRDRHTAFKLPAPWADMVAYLPFALEDFWEGTQRRLIVTKIFESPGDASFAPGVEITHWNGIPIARFVESLSWQTNGANPYARIALALRSLTVRPLGYFLPPDEDWVTLTYTVNGAFKSIAFPWRVYFPSTGSAAARATTEPNGAAAVLQGVDRSTLIVNGTWADIFSITGGLQLYAPLKVRDPMVGADSLLTENLLYQSIELSTGTFGYIRIFSFDAPASELFVMQFAEILKAMPRRGLIIDLRANPGGTIPSGEALVQLFSDEPVRTSPVTFRSTPGVQRLVNGQSFLEPWRRSLNMHFETGHVFSQGYTLTDPDLGSSIGRVYHGPVVLIIDALCYSTTDFFAADMQDNGLAKIIGLDPVTGAGGANVWTHAQLAQFVNLSGGSDVTPMPRGADMNVAMRRSLRVGINDGLPVEGLGVKADYLYRLTKRDILGQNADLVEYAANILSEMQ